MGSKKAIGQAKRAWERQIERPLEAVHMTNSWTQQVIATGDAFTQMPAISGAMAFKEWDRNHRTIYAVDRDLRDELTRSGLPEDTVPTDILRHLPHECPMFVLDEPVLVHHDGFDCLYGQFIVLPVFFSNDLTSMSESTLATCNGLRIVWFGHNVNDKNDYAVSTHTIDLSDNSLDLHEQMKQIISDLNHATEDLQPLPKAILEARDSNWGTTISTMFPIAVMSILYACSDEPDFVDIEAPRILQSRGSVKGDGLQIRQMGMRIGTALRSHRAASSASSTGSSQGAMTPHMRRAHWHRFWTGPRDGERRLTIKWLPPIPVNIDRGAIDATVRPLRSA